MIHSSVAEEQDIDDRTDFELLAAWREGDARAGNELVSRHAAALYRFFRYRIDDDLTDLAQRTFLACVEMRDRIPDGIGFRAYLFGVARNKLLHHLRKRHRERAALDRAGRRPPETIRSASRGIAVREEERLLLEALRGLPLDLQLAIQLFYWEELKITEIARVLDLAEGTVKSRLARAKTRLRLRIAELAVDEDLRKSTIDNLDRWAGSLRDLGDAEAKARDGSK